METGRALAMQRVVAQSSSAPPDVSLASHVPPIVIGERTVHLRRRGAYPPFIASREFGNTLSEGEWSDAYNKLPSPKNRNRH